MVTVPMNIQMFLMVTPIHLFDYKYADGGWTGLDLKNSHVIRKIVYAPRNRDNFIRKGNNYELFYWNVGKWESLGGQTAGSDVLQYNVPKGFVVVFEESYSWRC